MLGRQNPPQTDNSANFTLAGGRGQAIFPPINLRRRFIVADKVLLFYLAFLPAETIV
jgi:hypothetical protein